MDWPIAFSSTQRIAYLEQLSTQEWDLLVVGGGITGAGIALDASLRGLKVALVEKHDFAAGTSSRSTKLVHGGLRYLKNGEFGLVKQLGRERIRLYNNAAHLVSPQKMILPFTKGRLLKRLGIAAALCLYDSMAQVPYHEKHLMLNAQQLASKEPVLNGSHLRFGARIYEYTTDDARLTLSVLQKATEHGARPINYTELKQFTYNNNGKINGATISDVHGGKTYQICAKTIVNATGAWTDKLRQLDRCKTPENLHITKGSHLVVRHHRLPIQHALYFTTKDKRMVFAIPKWDKVYIGTTDTSYKGQLEQAEASKNDVAYILNAINKLVPQAMLVPADVLSTWAGLRPLIQQVGKKPMQVSHKEVISESASGLISIAGGKLTGYRLMAKKITDRVCKQLPQFAHTTCSTAQVPVYGAEFDFERSAASVEQYGEGKHFEARSTGISFSNFIKLFYRYGTKVDLITELAYDIRNQPNNRDEAWLRAEVRYAIEQEMALYPADFFMRRTSLALFNPEMVDSLRKQVEELFAEQQGA